MKNKIEMLVLDSIKEIGQDLGNAELETPSLETTLYGAEGSIDSLTLVTLIATIEEKMASELNRDVILADEKAMSQVRSPFLSAKTLCAYIETLVEGAA